MSEQPAAAAEQAVDSTNPKDLLGLKKVPMRLMISPAIVELAAVMRLGAKKYGPWNWRKKKVRWSVYHEAILRHLFQSASGEDADSESGRPHEAHIMACCLIIMDAKHTGNIVDDREKCEATLKMLAALIEQ